MDKVLGEDPKRAMLGGLLQAWYAVYGDQEKVLADVIAELELESPHAAALSVERQHLRHAIKEAVPSKTPTRDTSQFGYWLSGKQRASRWEAWSLAGARAPSSADYGVLSSLSSSRGEKEDDQAGR